VFTLCKGLQERFFYSVLREYRFQMSYEENVDVSLRTPMGIYPFEGMALQKRFP